MAMNVVVTPHQPVCLYSAAGGEGEPPYYSHWLSGGPPGVQNIIIFSRQRAQDDVFWTFSIPKPSCFSRIKLVMKNDLAPRRGYCWGSSSLLKDLKEKTPSARQYEGRCDMKTQAKDDADKKSKLRLKELRLGTMIKAKDDTDLKSKRLCSP
jgi:hypothetical protein